MSGHRKLLLGRRRSVKATSTPSLWVAPISPYSGEHGGSLVSPEDAASLGVPLTNLDEPLFDGAGRPSATSSPIWRTWPTGSFRSLRTERSR